TESHEDSESSSTLHSPRREKQERTKIRKIRKRSPSRERGRLNKKKSRDLKKEPKKLFEWANIVQAKHAVIEDDEDKLYMGDSLFIIEWDKTGLQQ
ncbi:25607_t:CDS:2, partial [Dentiscutata erythropus]